jgi:hypothetical protein
VEFFGDRERPADPRDLAAAVERSLERARALPAGPLRHEAVAASLVAAGALAQGLGDAAGDDPRAAPLERAAMALVSRVASLLWRSWRSGGRARPSPAAARVRWPLALPPAVRAREPEGYGLYALYPETYAVAAQALRGGPDLTVVGIRSIGTGLAGMVAAAAGAREPPFSVRPEGHPFDRRFALPAALAARAARPGAAFAVVDEGPGLSGESFAAVAGAILRAGVAEDRVHLFTSHAWAPGGRARPHVRALLDRLPRHFAPFEALFLAPGPLSLAALAEDAIGPATALEDLTAGGWRARLYSDPARWPPSAGWLERRKHLVTARGARFLARFAGLGAVGERKLARAHALADAGLAARPAALRHGFLFEPWREHARPLDRAGAPPAVIRDAVRRLVLLSAARPRAAGDGAPPAELAELARVNAGEALGAAGAEAARRLDVLLPEVARQARPVEVDGKMQRWEWLVLADGRLQKADGVDHHAAHDRAGCQDALWDVAGAQLELGLTEREALRIAEAARAAGPGADPSLLPFYRACLAALEVGRWSYAAAAAPPGAERARRERALARYRRALGRELAALGAARGRRRRGVAIDGAPPDARR